MYDALPEKARKHRFFLTLRLKITQALGEKAYAETLEQLHALYPDDPSAVLLSIDLYTLRKQFDKALATVDKLDEVVGGDPFLDTVRANTYVEMNRPEKAKAAATKATEAMPDLTYGYYSRIGVALATKDYPEVLATLKLMDGRLAMQFNDMAAIPEYAGFVKSPEYAGWQRYLREKAEAAADPKAERAKGKQDGQADGAPAPGRD